MLVKPSKTCFLKSAQLPSNQLGSKHSKYEPEEAFPTQPVTPSPQFMEAESQGCQDHLLKDQVIQRSWI